MSFAGRIRRPVTWGMLSVTLLLVAATVVSSWYFVLWKSNAHLYAVKIQHGRILVGWRTTSHPSDFPGKWVSGHNAGAALEWWPEMRRGHWMDAVLIPLWMPASLTALAFVALMRRRRRGGHDECPVCLYDLTGNVSGICPECGEVIMRDMRRIAGVILVLGTGLFCLYALYLTTAPRLEADRRAEGLAGRAVDDGRSDALERGLAVDGREVRVWGERRVVLKEGPRDSIRNEWNDRWLRGANFMPADIVEGWEDVEGRE